MESVFIIYNSDDEIVGFVELSQIAEDLVNDPEFQGCYYEEVLNLLIDEESSPSFH